MLFINISSDKIHLTDGTHKKFLDRNGIEDVLGPVLIDRQKKAPFTEIFLINGPGGFTNLRVGTLMLNTLNMFQKDKIQIFEIDKLTLFAHLVKAGLLPEKGIIYLGQKHNVWLVDFSKTPPISSECKLTDIPASAFLDEVHDETYRPQGTKNMIKFTNKDGKIYAHYQNEKHEITVQDLKLKPIEVVEANYMIEPILN